jgi:dihydroflavonol-4-reductase
MKLPMIQIMNLTGKVVAVTGASGMLGVYICRALLHQGAKVRGVVRNPKKAAFLGKEGVVFAKADLKDRAALTQAFQGVDVIVSNAAQYSLGSMRNWEKNYAANKEGTENVYIAAQEAGVKRIIHISTFGIYKLKPGTALREEAPQKNGVKGEGGAYRATKQMSEAMAWEFARKYHLDLTTLRPSGIYGARDPNFIPLIRKFMKWPLLLAPMKGFPIGYAGDIANAVVGALRNDVSIGEAYNTGGDDTSFYSFFKAWKEVTGKGPLLIPLPMPTGLMVDNSKAKNDLGFSNRTFQAGLQDIVSQESL